MYSSLHPVLVISYDENVRSLMVKTLRTFGVTAMSCSSFCDAESLALTDLFSGVLVDIPSMVKAKGEEKIVSCSLGNVFPILRVRTIGTILIPMVLSGGATQAKSLQDFLTISCQNHTPRRLRAYRRHIVHTPIQLIFDDTTSFGFTHDLSWGGAFVATTLPENFIIGADIQLVFVCDNFKISGSICRIQPWGIHGVIPGIGVRWHKPVPEEFEKRLQVYLKASKDHDKDRIIG